MEHHDIFCAKNIDNRWSQEKCINGDGTICCNFQSNVIVVGAGGCIAVTEIDVLYGRFRSSEDSSPPLLRRYDGVITIGSSLISERKNLVQFSASVHCNNDKITVVRERYMCEFELKAQSIF